ERCRARALEGQDRFEEAARTWERLGELDRAVELYVRSERWLDVARLEGSAALRESGRSVRKIRELVESGAWEEAGPLAEVRLEMLRPRLPDIPWFVASEEARQAWQEFCLLNDLENRCRALRAEAEGAWSLAARCWQKSGDHDRAAAAWGRRFEAIRDPLRRARAWVAAGEPEKAVQVLTEAGAPAGEQGATLVEAWKAEHVKDWSRAAVLWRSLGRPREEARCLHRAAGKLEGRVEPWRLLDGHSRPGSPGSEEDA
ncbi:MAG TPA: hypothetical protein VHU81_08065, partial [Thermoanaerobaculia bacterium]|nr:hypothetical protein [Thermoanaerobaculia bacterium]